MLHGDIVIPHGPGLILRPGQNAIQLAAQVFLPPCAADLRQSLDETLKLILKTLLLYAHLGDQICDQRVLHSKQSRCEMLLIYLLVAVFHSELLCKLYRLLRLLRKFTDIHSASPLSFCSISYRT